MSRRGSSLLAPAVLEPLEAARRRLAEGGRRVLVLSSVDDARGDWGDPPPFDAAWIALTSVAGLDAPALGRRLASALESGAPVVCSFPTPRPLPAVLERVLRGTGEWAGPGADVGLSVADWRDALGDDFSWHRARALGLLIPSRPDEAWAERNALLLGGIAALEHAVGSWPLLRGLGERVVIEGARR